MKRSHTLHATIRTWKDDDGTVRKHQAEVGAIFESDAGALVVKIDAIPLSRDWSGYMRAIPCAPSLPPGRRQPKGFPPPPQKQP